MVIKENSDNSDLYFLEASHSRDNVVYLESNMFHYVIIVIIIVICMRYGEIFANLSTKSPIHQRSFMPTTSSSPAMNLCTKHMILS